MSPAPTGFIGGRVVRLLARQGHEVTALVRQPAAAADLANVGIFHIAAWYKVGVREAPEAERINVGGTRNVLGLISLVERIAPVPALYASETLRVMAGPTYLGSSAKAARRSLEMPPRRGAAF